MRSEAEAEEEARAARASLNAIPGIGDINAELLYQWGYRSSEQLSEADPDNFEVEGISADRARQIVSAARDHVANKKRIEEAKAAAEAEAAAAAAAAAAVAASAEAPATGTEAAGDGGSEAPAAKAPDDSAASDAEGKS